MTEHLGQLVRIVLIMLVITSGWRLWWLLQRDKVQIYPPYWVPILRALVLAIGLTGAAIIVALAVLATITAATWLMIVGYSVLVTVAFRAPRTHR